MNASVSFRDLLAVAVVKSRRDCQKELHTLQERTCSLEAALHESNAERKRLLDANEGMQQCAEEVTTLMKHAETASVLIADLRRKNTALRHQLDNQPVGPESTDFRQLALDAHAGLRVSRESGPLHFQSSSKTDDNLQCPARPEAILQSVSILHYR